MGFPLKLIGNGFPLTLSDMGVLLTQSDRLGFFHEPYLTWCFSLTISDLGIFINPYWQWVSINPFNFHSPYDFGVFINPVRLGGFHSPYLTWRFSLTLSDLWCSINHIDNGFLLSLSDIGFSLTLSDLGVFINPFNLGIFLNPIWQCVLVNPIWYVSLTQSVTGLLIYLIWLGNFH